MNFSWRGFPGGDEHWLVRGVCRGLFHRVRSRPVGSTFPGGGVPRRAVFPGEREWEALPGRDEHRLVRGVAGGYFIELVLDVPRGTTFPGVASPGCARAAVSGAGGGCRGGRPGGRRSVCGWRLRRRPVRLPWHRWRPFPRRCGGAWVPA